MMKRSIVTTDVAVCLTTLLTSSREPSVSQTPDARRRVRPCIDLEAIPKIAAAQ
jgi:hypothetical protein